jgi:O-antigen biosynthesis protein WbqP
MSRYSNNPSFLESLENPRTGIRCDYFGSSRNESRFSRHGAKKHVAPKEGYSHMKRALDFAACFLVLLVLWPILLIVVVLIRLESRGPAVFKQVRVGKHGRAFTCYKFRTMFAGTGDVPTHQVSATSITALGTYLRRFKIDELPQLFNVLAGDMSVVGPRPCLPSQIELVEARRRLGVLQVRPGITGLAQVRGIDMSNPNRLAEIDAQYVESQSFAGDVKLIWATLRGRGVGIDQVVRT